MENNIIDLDLKQLCCSFNIFRSMKCVSPRMGPLVSGDERSCIALCVAQKHTKSYAANQHDSSDCPT